ncbi:MAG: hypothetical protein BWZ06_00678 [Bacteroidetes bacterium ADurb.BinA261]|nr:MAG: hypothetical protein BWZ06_00678 [Bacteroidetes bacterium ADurb.BinA261]
MCQRIVHCLVEQPPVFLHVLVNIVVPPVIVGRQQRRHFQQVANVVAVHASNLYSFLVIIRVNHILAEANDVATIFLPEAVLRIDACRVAAVLRCGGITNGSRLIEIRKAHGKARVIRSPGEVDRVAGDGGILHHRLVEPVCSFPGTIVDGCEQVGRQLLFPFVKQSARRILREQGIVYQGHVLLRIGGAHPVGDGILYTDIPVVRYLCLPGFALFGGHQQHPVGCTGAVDRSRGGILQDVDRLDVAGIERIDRSTRHPVDHVEGFIARGGSETTYVNLVVLTHLSRALGDVYTRGVTLQGAQHARGILFLNLVTLHLDRGTGHQLLLLYTISYNHQFLQCFCIFL